MADSGSLEDYLVRFPVVWQRHVYGFSSWPTPRTITRLSVMYQQFLRDVGQSLCGRMKRGVAIGELTIRNIRIIDGVATLPPPPIDPSEFRRPISEYRNICIAVFDFSGLVPSVEKSHFLVFLQLSSLNLLSFQNLFFHFIFQSAKANLSFLMDATDYLEDNEQEIVAQLGVYWRRSYKRFSRRRLYDIENSIQANVYLQGVYRYHQDPKNPTRKPYEDTCVGLLRFLTNVKKHANQQRRQHGRREWQPDELEILIDYYFPGEMLHLFDFFWANNLLMDFTQSLRTHE